MYFLAYDNRSGEVVAKWELGDDDSCDPRDHAQDLAEQWCVDFSMSRPGSWIPSGCGDLTLYTYVEGEHEPLNGTCWDSCEVIVT